MSIAAVVDEFRSVLADPNVGVLFGRAELVRHERPPRIVFVPSGGPIGATTEIGRRDIGGQSTRSIHERALKCEIYCWGRTFSEAETLLENTVVALRRTALASYELGAESWITETDDGQADLQYGAVVMLEAVLYLPVVDALKKVDSGVTDMSVLNIPGTITHTGKFAIVPLYGFAGLVYGAGAGKYGGSPDTSC